MEIPIKSKSIKLTGDYAEGWVDIRLNPPVGKLLDAIEQFQNADKNNLSQVIPAVYALLSQLVIAWNFQSQGTDIPVSIDGFKMLPPELLLEIAVKAETGVTAVPLASKATSTQPLMEA